MCRFVVAEVRSEFLCSGSRQRKQMIFSMYFFVCFVFDFVGFFSHTLYVLQVSIGSQEMVRDIPVKPSGMVCRTPNSYIMVFHLV